MEKALCLVVSAAFIWSLFPTEADDTVPQVKSAAARRAESEFEKTVASAEREFQAKVRQASATLVKELEKARSAATKAGELDDAVAIRDRIKQLGESGGAPRRSTTNSRDRLERDVSGSSWTGSPNWGRFVLNVDGTASFEKMKDQTSRWGAFSHEAVGVMDAGGNVSVLVFDSERRHVRAHYAGQIGKHSWEATRARSK